MKISTKGRYGIRALLFLALNSSDGQVSLSVIAEKEGISFNYLEQVFSLLRKGGIVKSIKGPQGGYELNRPPEKVKMIDVIKLLEGNYKIIEGNKIEGITEEVINNVLWSVIDNRIEKVLSTITLQDLVNEYEVMNSNGSNMYYI